MAMKRVTIEFNSVFREVNHCRRRYRVLKGSAGSGKSVNIAQDYVLKLMDPRYKGANLLVVRKVEGSNKDSTYAELLGAISRTCGDKADLIWDTTTNPLQMTCRITGSRVIFRGMNDARQREKVKSITFPTGKLTWIWIEEATELEESDVDILDDRLRGLLDNPNLYYQITFTFNPVSASHWIKRKYFDITSPDIFTHHSTYLDNRFIDEAYHRRMELRQVQDPDGYRVYGLGEWGETGGLILTHYLVEEFCRDQGRFDFMVHSQDFGFNHANAILTVGFKDGELYICDEIYVYEHDTTEIIEIAQKKGLSKSLRMWCDSAEPDRIKMWHKAGYKAMAVKKEPGSVRAQIDYLKGLKIHIHPDCRWTLKEIQAWRWRKDGRTGLYTDEPVEFFDDAMAALRYSVEDLRRRRGKGKPRSGGSRIAPGLFG
ncbi:PBSX family phage terminase large subunit [Dethiosulfovibrio salsuginis]|uniref:Phage terminase large subunit n=1 Tax=Dethiosulfovibrio salsuginis TaxID=561720 RepID=A0A1X7LDA3_9BACT|nr:PBSX family phage terminase large subunit [Dethiosulfovibrio salsuginis]SMG51680.1 phage terminase large subunit [Dethiosulfovibrio salsuginis]